MKVEKITTNLKIKQANYDANNTQIQHHNSNSQLITNTLNIMATLNKPSFTGYELGLSKEELAKRASSKHLSTITLLTPESPEYINLSKNDKHALKHLSKAVDIIGEIELQLDDENNIPFRAYLKKEIAKGNNEAKLAQKLFDGQRGIFGQDIYYNNISLAKGLKQTPGHAYYPQDLSTEEFHNILTEMINKGKTEEVKTILNQRSVVIRDGKYLKGIDYINKFKKEFNEVADELIKASKYSSDKNFNQYLRLQAKALRTANPILDAKADMKWAELEDTPLEFTITRENYDDKMTATIFNNPKLLALLKKHGITPIAKDSLGARAGIVNKEGTEFLKNSKHYLPYLAELMPFKDEYEQVINNNNKQTMVDVDLVNLSGNIREYRGKITLAENLPNIDKLSVQLGGGRRNVYHRQIRAHKPKQVGDFQILITDEQKKFINTENNHYFTIAHENAHSLGPKNVKNLGIYTNILEENKADMAAISFIDELQKLGVYTKEERDGILTSFVIQNFLKAKPDMEIAHRVRQVMQGKYLADNEVYSINSDGKIVVDIDKVIPTAKKMLEEIIRIQIDDNYKDAEEFVNKYFIWTEDMEFIAEKLREISFTMNGTVKTPLANYLSNYYK